MTKFWHIFYIVSTIGVVIVSCFLIYIQKSKSGRILVILLLLWALFSAFKSIYDYNVNRPKPKIIIESIHTASDKSSLLEITTKFQNTGNTVAKDFSAKRIAMIDDSVKYEKPSKRIHIEPGKIVSTDVIRLKGDYIKGIFDKKNELSMSISFTYSDSYGSQYSKMHHQVFSPEIFGQPRGIGSSWIIIER